MSLPSSPTGLRLEQNKLHLEGYPNAERIVLLKSLQTRRLGDLRLHQAALMFCENAMREFDRFREQSEIVSEAIIIGVVTKYFSCFGDNKASTPLNPDKVFKSQAEAKSCFLHWKDIRNKCIVHDESDNTSILTGLVLGRDSEVQDVVSLNIDVPIFLHGELCQILHDLIDHTLKFVQSEVDELLPKILCDARALSVSDREGLPNLTYTPRSLDQASVTRGKA